MKELLWLLAALWLAGKMTHLPLFPIGLALTLIVALFRRATRRSKGEVAESAISKVAGWKIFKVS